ncbi:Protocadherin-9, partial [Clonorchis sinensis]
NRGKFSNVRTDSGPIVDRLSCSPDGHVWVNLHVNLLTDDLNLCIVYRVSVLVKDVDDNGPEFSSRSWYKLLKEMLYRKGRRITLPEAKDADLFEEHRRVFYRISALETAPFRLRSETASQPELVVTRDLDAEEQRHHRFVLTAYSPNLKLMRKTSPSLSNPEDTHAEAHLEVHIEIENMNDNEPWFEYTTYNVSVTEDTPVGMSIFRMSARDADEAAQLVYSMGPFEQTQTGSSTFAIEADGTVRLQKALDYELCQLHAIAVQVSDGEFMAQTRLLVHVLDTNDEPPVFDLNPMPLVIEENTSTGKIIGQIRIHDADSDSVNGKVLCWEPAHLQRRQALSFQPDLHISPAAGSYDLLTNMVIDRENTTKDDIGHLRVFLICSDGNALLDGVTGSGKHTTTMSILVFIDDINDNSPVFTKSIYHVNMAENNSIGQKIVQIKAEDEDEGQNANVTYSILDTANFKVEPNSGWITANTVFDREARDSYQVTIVASDQGNPPLSSTALLNLTILETKQPNPLGRADQKQTGFSLLPGSGRQLEADTFIVRENAPPNTYIGDVVASQDQWQGSGKMYFELLDDTPNLYSTRFRLLRNGSLYTTVKLDREEREEYQLEVRVNSQIIFGSVISTGKITIRVLDENDNAPNFVHPPGLLSAYRVNKPEHTKTESGASNILYDQPFVATDVTFHSETLPSEALSAVNSTLVWNRTDAKNEISTAMQVGVQEKPGYVVTTLKAIDADIENNGRVTYDIIEISNPSGQPTNHMQSDPLLQVDPHLGEVTLRRTPSSEELGIHYFRVGASDNGYTKANTEFKILVLVITDTSPIADTSSNPRLNNLARDKEQSQPSIIRLNSNIIIAAYSATLSVLLFIVIIIVTLAIRRHTRRRPQWNRSAKKDETNRLDLQFTDEYRAEKPGTLISENQNSQKQRVIPSHSEVTRSEKAQTVTANFPDVHYTYGYTCANFDNSESSDSSKVNEIFHKRLKPDFEPFVISGVQPFSISSFTSSETEESANGPPVVIEITGSIAQPFENLNLRSANMTSVNFLEAVMKDTEQLNQLNLAIYEIRGSPT